MVGAVLGVYLAAVGASLPALRNDLGNFSVKVTFLHNTTGQLWFDQGLRLAFAFDFPHAIDNFRAAYSIDPTCATCAFAEAWALGPNINQPMDPDAESVAYAAGRRAAVAIGNVEYPGWEQALAGAVQARYSNSTNTTQRHSLDLAYAAAMRRAWKEHPESDLIGALFADALMQTEPWDYYMPHDPSTPNPAGADAIAACETVLARSPQHIGAIHYYIHLTEPSPTPQRAQPYADRLGKLVPGAPHLVHMPGHIYIHTGRMHDASAANLKATTMPQQVYTGHNLNFLQATLRMEGRSSLGIKAARTLRTMALKLEEGPAPPQGNELWTVPYLHTLTRFQLHDDISAVPQPPAKLRYDTGVWLGMRAISAAQQQRVEAAEELVDKLHLLVGEVETDPVYQAFASGLVPFLCADMLYIMENIARGEISRASHRPAEAVKHFALAARVYDTFPYSEPPQQWTPPRQYLGQAQLEAADPGAALATFRADLAKFPSNGWSLRGVQQACFALNQTACAEDAGAALVKVWGWADVSILNSIDLKINGTCPNNVCPL
eukprot:Hpha_TRINITY_DN18668_c0_g1::TRINITY_DN18668_c0_g1_i1::g.115625::m.115625